MTTSTPTLSDFRIAPGTPRRIRSAMATNPTNAKSRSTSVSTPPRKALVVCPRHLVRDLKNTLSYGGVYTRALSPSPV
jgi:hypothetical protein